MPFPNRISAAAFLLGAGVLLAGCATAPPPVDLMSKSGTALKQAEQGGAGQHAPLELKFARQKYAEAQAAMSREDYGEAGRLAQEALVNAQLAEAKAAAARARAAAQETRKEVEALRDELLRSEEQQ